MKRRSEPRTSGIHEINMTSLIDISLVLVLVLMVATPLAFQSSILVRQAASAGLQAEEESRAERIEIEILSAEDLSVNRQSVPRAELASALAPLLAESSTRTVVVRCQDDVPHGAFVSVLDDAKQCGADRIAVVGR